jgi:hypothetical protein
MTASSNSNRPPSNVIRLPKQQTTVDYLKTEAPNRQLIRAIKAYYARDNITPKVWIEKERLGTGDFVYTIRSNLVFVVPPRIKNA